MKRPDGKVLDICTLKEIAVSVLEEELQAGVGNDQGFKLG